MTVFVFDIYYFRVNDMEVAESIFRLFATRNVVQFDREQSNRTLLETVDARYRTDLAKIFYCPFPRFSKFFENPDVHVIKRQCDLFDKNCF